MDEKDTNNKQFYKKAWFWVIVALGATAIAVALVVAPMITASKIVVDTATSIVEQSQTQNSSEKKEYSIGELINIGGIEYVVDSIDRNYSTGNQFITPSDGKEFIKVNISLTNKSGENKSYNAYYWKIEDENGDITSYSIMGQADDAMSSGELAPGGSKKASIVFEVPVGSQAKVHIQPNVFNSNEEFIIVL